MRNIFHLKMTSFIVWLSLYFTFCFNFPTLAKIFSLSHTVSNPIFPYTAPIVLIAAFIIIFSCLCWPYIFKAIMIFLTITSSMALFAEVNYHTLFDNAIIESIFQTRSDEALSYVNLHSITYIVVFGLVPSIWIACVKITKRETFLKEIIARIVLIGIATTALLIIALTNYKSYAAVGRNNHYLNRMIIPGHVYAGGKYLYKEFIYKPLPYKKQGLDATLPATKNNKPTLFVMVLGETARTYDYAYNGYKRDTNPYTKNEGIISFRNVQSCGTYTALSVPCMFSNLTRAHYNQDRAYSQDNAVDIIHRAGAEVLWIDNDGGSKGVADRVPYVTTDTSKHNQYCDGTSCYDGVMLNKAAAFINKDDKNKLLILHLIGSHGPTYFQRYPKQFDRFKPSCNRSDIENCTDQEIKNVYDNTILYTDYVDEQVIKLLKKNENKYNVAMLYMSDHGESLGENGFYLHGAPYPIAPKEQKHVPWLLWIPTQYAQQKGINLSCLKAKENIGHLSQDNLFHSLLGLYGVQSKVINPALDISASCKVAP
ncbi:phosphoethanolamine transferase [Photobacterium phosphoreum]|uniref:Phosphoethanolamine transferase n=2 Tax=Photobacterium phosphoreum TaxID=659 RepID=A0A2T3JRT4_PHOPO|nr:phosphoethanolamine--lipid A transferase [Photobacterium phosphoreum]PSU24801.1 phosphoethanolamine transferase [Photobacterium phosphoreum]PSU36717.1 phosphoethanolamine transferase [Photobacterium phosphoreum]PSU51816.1 phosphoethanolamine transferase [Photobacterium phosphoreum]